MAPVDPPKHPVASDRFSLPRTAVLACAALLPPYAFQESLQQFDGLLAAHRYATLLGVLVSGLVMGTIRPRQVQGLAWTLGCAPAVANAVYALAQCPG